MKRTNPCIGRDCRQTQLLLDEYSSGELGAVQNDAIASHLASCDTCRLEYDTLTTSRQALAHYPQIQASPDFDMRVLDQLLQEQARSDSFFDRLDAIFARPLYKLMGSAVLSIILGVLTLALVVGPQSLLEGVASPSNEANAPSPLTVENPADALDPFYASRRLYPELWREGEPMLPSPAVPVVPKGGEPAWKPSKESSSDGASDFSYSAPSGSSC